MQVSGRDGSHWSSPPLSHNSDSLTFNSEGSLMTESSLPPHHIMLPSQIESGICDVDSDVTGSSHGRARKLLHSPYNSTGVGTSSESSGKGYEIPQMFQNRFPRSASVEDTANDHPAEVLASIQPRRGMKLPGKYPFTSLSQDTCNSDHGRYPFYSPSSVSLSQSTNPHMRMHHRDPYYHKPGSPASSSDTSSLASSMANRIGSQSASEISFSTTSSSRSNPRLPRPHSYRPPSLSSSSGSTLFTHKPVYSIPEYVPHTRSEVMGFPPYLPAGHYDSDHDETLSTPNLSSMKKGQKEMAAMKRSNPAKRPSLPEMRERGMVQLRERERDRRKRKPEHSRILEEGPNPRDSFSMKLEMVLSVLSIVSPSKDRTDADAAKILLALSQSSETCSVMRQSACMNMLINIMHNIEQKSDKSHKEARLKAAEAMRNIIESTGDTRQGKYELCILGVVEKVRAHCDMLFDFIYSHLPSSRRVDPTEVEAVRNACDSLMHPVRKLYKYSNEKEHYRPAIHSLGGLQATAEILVVNYKLISGQKGSRPGDKTICLSSKAVTVVISVLINLTYGDVSNKTVLCMFPDFLKALMFHIKQQNEAITSAGAQVLRNLSWRASREIKEALLKCGASVILMGAIDHVKEETTIQHITSALWNLSAHSFENRHKICSSYFGIEQLVDLLSYNSPSGTTAVVENVGGTLKNLSVVIMQEEEYRRKFRESGGLAKLVQHLKSKNKTVLANATGILWNLSARSFEDQKLLWDLGCIPLLDVLQTAHQKNIAECARGALRNLLAFGQSHGWTSKSDVTAYNIKTQRGLSKSLTYAANYAFSHSTSSHPGKESNESLHSRRSQTVSSKNGSAASLPHTKSTERIPLESRSGRRGGHDEHDGHGYKDSNSSNEEDDYLVQKNRNKLRFARVGSAPQASSKDEWSSYVPGSYVTNSKQPKHPSFMTPRSPYLNDMKQRKAPKSARSRGTGRAIPYSLSQSESYQLSSNSELHSVSAASFGLSPHFSNEPGEAASLSALANDLDPKLESFDPSHPARIHEEYADLEVDDDDNDDIDHPVYHEDTDPSEHFSCADNFARIQTTIRRGNESSRPPTSGMMKKLGTVSPTKGGTGSLALDGMTDDQDDSDDPRLSRRHGSKIHTDV